MLVLLVDDSPDVLEAITNYLGWRGYGVITFNNVPEAITWLRSGLVLPNIVVCDLILGKGDKGTDLLIYIRENHPKLPFVLFSGYTLELEESTDRLDPQKTPDVRLEKPFSLSELRALIDKYATK